jgi:hypothetical protein
MLKSIQKQLTDAEINRKFFNFVAQMAHFWTMYGLVKTVGDLGHTFHLGIPVKVNSDSSGKPNNVPIKANSRRIEATLAS